MLDDHEQTTLMEIGKEGCYLLVVKRMAELETGKQFDPVGLYNMAVGRGWLRSDCLLLDAAAILSYLTDKLWVKTKEAPDFRMSPVEGYIATEYTLKRPSGVATHFVLTSPVVYNPLVLDMTAWSVDSLRVFRRAV